MKFKWNCVCVENTEQFIISITRMDRGREFPPEEFRKRNGKKWSGKDSNCMDWANETNVQGIKFVGRWEQNGEKNSFPDCDIVFSYIESGHNFYVSVPSLVIVL